MHRVAVIGAGPAGLCAARSMLRYPKLFTPVVFEQGDEIGGTWVYREESDPDKHLHGTMYARLRTNFPKEAMSFLNFPVDPSLPSFIHHTEVLKYLQDYSKHFQLERFVKLNEKVVSVDYLSESSGESNENWLVTTRNSKGGMEKRDKFHAVLVCNGHYDVPNMANIKNSDLFGGRIVHSKYYRRPEEFKDKKVVCMGGGPSGVDIALDISSQAKQVIVASHSLFSQENSPLSNSNLQLRPDIKECTSSGVIFANDSCEENVDAIVLCTGFKYQFPFLKPPIALREISDRRLTPLYQHLIHVDYPTLAFIGITWSIAPFVNFDIQIQYFLKTLSGQLRLPSKQEMLLWADNDLKERVMNQCKWPERYAHKMSATQWQYLNDLIKQADLEPLSPAIQGVYADSSKNRSQDATTYKDRQYRLLPDGGWKCDG